MKMSLGEETQIKPVLDPSSEKAKQILPCCDPPKASLDECSYISMPAAGQRPIPRRKIPELQNKVPPAPIQVNEIPELTPEEKLQKKKEGLQIFKDEFRNRGILKDLFGLVELKVKCATMSTAHLLDEKRTRLRELLLAEEVAYTTEYIALCQQHNAGREEELYKRALELKAKAERERKQFVEEKLFEQKVLSCDALRTVLSQKQLMEVKQDQLWQIKEKHALEEARREEERMYHDLMIKNLQSMKEEEEENAKLEKIKQQETKELFMSQLKQKEEKAEEEKRMQELERMQLEEEMRLFKEEEAKEKDQESSKYNKFKAELCKLIEEERERKERRKREEEEIERTFNKLLEIEAEKEKVKEANAKEKLKKETSDYLENTRELKRRQEEEEKIFDQMLEELNEKKRQQKDAERRRLRDARNELFQNVIKIREEQMKEKQERLKREAEMERAEIELLTLQLEQQDKIKEEYNRRCAEKREEYKCQLLQQIQEIEEARRREKEEDAAYMRSIQEKEEKEVEEMKYILNAASVSAKDHPMKVITKQVPPKYPCLHPYM